MNRPAGDLFRDPLPADAPAAAPPVGPEALRAVAEVLSREAPELLLNLAAIAARAQDSPGAPATTAPESERDWFAAEAAARLQAALGPVLPQARVMAGLRHDLQQAWAENTHLRDDARIRARSHEIALAGHERRLAALRDKLQQERTNAARRRGISRIWRRLLRSSTPDSRPRS